MRKKIRNALLLSLTLFLLLGMTQATQAIPTVDLFSENVLGESDFGDAVDNWLTNSYTVVENFNDYPSSSWHGSLDTNVGTFSKPTDSDLYGTGGSSAIQSGETPGDFQILSNPNYGRDNDGNNYLDSADNAKMTLTLKSDSYQKLGFYINDPSDVGAWTRITARNGGEDDVSIDYQQSNGSLHFIGISTDTGFLSEIIWETFENEKFRDPNYALGSDDYYTNDGWGISGFTRVPEPATLLLFGTGLAGLAGFARRRRFNKS